MVLRIACVLCGMGACAPRPPEPRPAVVIVPAPTASAPAPAVRATAAASPTSDAPFVFRAGRPADALGAYATERWGPGGASVFSSAASVREGDVAGDPSAERLISVGRYAVVEVPARAGFFVRDLGPLGWVTSLDARPTRSAAPKRDVVLHYHVKDDGEDEDWARYRDGTLTRVTSFTHTVVEVWSFDGPPSLLFAHEIELWANCCGSERGPAPPRVSDTVQITPDEIAIRVASAWRARAASIDERRLPGVAPVIAPWDGIKARVFAWDGARFVLAREER